MFLSLDRPTIIKRSYSFIQTVDAIIDSTPERYALIGLFLGLGFFFLHRRSQVFSKLFFVKYTQVQIPKLLKNNYFLYYLFKFLHLNSILFQYRIIASFSILVQDLRYFSFSMFLFNKIHLLTINHFNINRKRYIVPLSKFIFKIDYYNFFLMRVLIEHVRVFKYNESLFYNNERFRYIFPLFRAKRLKYCSTYRAFIPRRRLLYRTINIYRAWYYCTDRTLDTDKYIFKTFFFNLNIISFFFMFNLTSLVYRVFYTFVYVYLLSYMSHFAYIALYTDRLISNERGVDLRNITTPLFFFFDLNFFLKKDDFSDFLFWRFFRKRLYMQYLTAPSIHKDQVFGLLAKPKLMRKLIRDGLAFDILIYVTLRYIDRSMFWRMSITRRMRRKSAFLYMVYFYIKGFFRFTHTAFVYNIPFAKIFLDILIWEIFNFHIYQVDKSVFFSLDFYLEKLLLDEASYNRLNYFISMYIGFTKPIKHKIKFWHYVAFMFILQHWVIWLIYYTMVLLRGFELLLIKQFLYKYYKSCFLEWRSSLIFFKFRNNFNWKFKTKIKYYVY